MSGNYGVFSKQERNDEVTDAIDHHYLDYPVKRERPDIDNDGIRSNNKKQKQEVETETASRYLYARVAKFFGDILFFGTIQDTALCIATTESRTGQAIQEEEEEEENDKEHTLVWVVHFDDGDSEDWDLSEVKEGIRLCQQQIQDDDDGGGDNHNKNVGCTLWELFQLNPIDNPNHVIPTMLPKEMQTINVTKFYLFVLERQRCFLRRRYHHPHSSSSLSPKFWTNVTIFQKYFFCNNYRQLDRGTTFFHLQILQLWDEFKAQNSTKSINQTYNTNNNSLHPSPPSKFKTHTWSRWFIQVLWASYCYRLVNKVESFGGGGAGDRGKKHSSVPATASFGRIPTMSDWPKFKKLVAKTKRLGQRFFTGAHQTTNFDDYMAWMDQVSSSPESHLEIVANAVTEHLNSSSRDALRALFYAIRHTLPGCGEFMSWQILCDLIESNAVPFLTSDSEDIDFCMLGKGAKGECTVRQRSTKKAYRPGNSFVLFFLTVSTILAGVLEVFFSDDSITKRKGKKKIRNVICLKSDDYLHYTRLLVDHQDRFYEEIKKGNFGMQLKFPKWRGRCLTMREIEHALCEFSRFQRIDRALNKGDSANSRLLKSRRYLDQRDVCCKCNQRVRTTTKPNGKKGNQHFLTEIDSGGLTLRWCDTCNQGYCKECSFSDKAMRKTIDIAEKEQSWLCYRCCDLESFRWSL